MIDQTVTIVISPDLAMCELDGGAALINLSTGTYFKLNSTAAKFCNLIETPKEFGQVLEEMKQIYDVEGNVLEAELSALIDTMSDQGLLSVQG